ncbi:hypothetical protein MKX01_041088 [Papaver californicum]|nr:hypothetical protein MKX01_041088 [Papaver californicum]
METAELSSKFCYSKITTATTTAAAASKTTITTTTTTTTATTTTSSTTTRTNFSTLLLSDFLFISSFISSNPLYFSYFIFFSPYLVKLLSFLSPLFFTTSLLLLTLLTVSPSLIDDLAESNSGFLLKAYNSVINTLRSKLDVQNSELHIFQQLEACILPVDHYTNEASSETDQFKGAADNLVVMYSTSLRDLVGVCEDQFSPCNLEAENNKDIEEFSQDVAENFSCPSTATFKDSKPLLVDDDRSDVAAAGVYALQKDVSGRNDTSDVTEISRKLEKTSGSIRKECLVPTDFFSDNDWEYIKGNVKSGSHFEVCGSMRKEKEWKRTLACKLYEERQTVDGSEEGMDSLWESYDTDTGKMKKTKNRDKTTTTAIKKTEIEDDEEMDGGPMCCLQALKFSTGKMNLGMRKPNLVKFSKALKGIGWFHQVSRRNKKP